MPVADEGTKLRSPNQPACESGAVPTAALHARQVPGSIQGMQLLYVNASDKRVVSWGLKEVQLVIFLLIFWGYSNWI